MRILILTPSAADGIGGPGNVTRVLSALWEAEGDEVAAVSFTSFERSLPIGIRQFALFLRLLLFPRPDAVLLLDPASTGPAGALYARLAGIPSVLRLGGDFLWETWTERRRNPCFFLSSMRSRARFP